MKKTILMVLFCLVGQISMAQNDFKTDVLLLIKNTGATASMDVAKKQITDMIPAEKREAFLKEFDAMTPALYEKMAAIYMEEFTHEDVKEAIKFYETPIGKKMASKAGVLFEKSMAASQIWAQQLQPLMMKYMQ
jgi:hypothetical protein